MRSRHETSRQDEESPRRWSLADDYLTERLVEIGLLPDAP